MPENSDETARIPMSLPPACGLLVGMRTLVALALTATLTALPLVSAPASSVPITDARPTIHMQPKIVGSGPQGGQATRSFSAVDPYCHTVRVIRRARGTSDRWERFKVWHNVCPDQEKQFTVRWSKEYRLVVVLFDYQRNKRSDIARLRRVAP